MRKIDILQELVERPDMARVSELFLGGVLSLKDARGVALSYLEKYPDALLNILGSDILTLEEERQYAFRAVRYDAYLSIFFCRESVLEPQEVKLFALEYLTICPWLASDFAQIVNQEELNIHIVKQRLRETRAEFGDDVFKKALNDLESY